MNKYDHLENKGGGVALYNKEKPDLVPSIVEGLCMELTLPNKLNILISKMYRPL